MKNDRPSPTRIRSLALSVYHPPPPERPWPLEMLFPRIPHGFYPYGRHAFLEALRLCGVGPEDRVLMPEFICREVLAPIHHLGAETLYYPVDKHLEAQFDPGSLPGAAAILAVNYFGFPQRLEPFRRYARRTGAFLIEDNAHGLFSQDYDGRLLGTRGDLGIFSLRKSISLPNGGALTVMRSELATRFRPPAEFSWSRSDRFYYRKSLARRFIGRSGLRGADMLISANRLARKIVTGHSIPAPNPDGERVMPVPHQGSPLLKKPITTADPQREQRRRRELYRFFHHHGRQFGIRRPLCGRLPQGVIPYGFPFRCSEDRFLQISVNLRKSGFLCISWPDLPAAAPVDSRPYYRTVRLVPFLW